MIQSHAGLLRNIRVDLICRISAYHVLDRLFSSRMVFEPGVDLQNAVFVDHDMLPFGDKALNVSSRQEGVLPGRSVCSLLHLAMRREWVRSENEGG